MSYKAEQAELREVAMEVMTLHARNPEYIKEACIKMSVQSIEEIMKERGVEELSRGDVIELARAARDMYDDIMEQVLSATIEIRWEG